MTWIPMSERLPKNGHYYLWCSDMGSVQSDYYWDGFEKEQKYGYNIVAWMPLPQPYTANRKTENSSEKPNNFEWSVEYAKEMLDTMPCEECGHWEHGAGDHYYCALLGMRQECCFESKGESTLMFANKPKDEPTISKMEQVEDEPQTDCAWK